MILNHIEFVHIPLVTTTHESHDIELFEEIIGTKEITDMYRRFIENTKRIIRNNHIDFINVLKYTLQRNIVLDTEDNDNEKTSCFTRLGKKKNIELLEIIHKLNIDIHTFNLNYELQILKMVGDIHRCYHSS